MKRISLLLVAAALFGASCERHEFDGPDGTRRLHEHHSSHGGDAPHADGKDAGH